MLPSPEELAIVWLSLRVAAMALVVALPLALWVAWLLARRPFPGKTALNVLVHTPLVLPPVVTGYLLLLALSPASPVGTFLAENLGLTLAFRLEGAALAAAIMAFPLMVRPMRLALEAVDPRLEAAARTLGASPIRVFWRISLPLALPGLIAGAILGFAKSLGEFGATITFAASIPGETQTLSLAVHALLQQPGGEAAALRLAVMALALAVGALAASELVSRRLANRLEVRDAGL